MRSSREKAGNEEGAQSRAGSTTVEGRHRVMALRGQGIPRALYYKERTQMSSTQRARKGQGWSGSEPGNQHPWVWWEAGIRLG